MPSLSEETQRFIAEFPAPVGLHHLHFRRGEVSDVVEDLYDEERFALYLDHPARREVTAEGGFDLDFDDFFLAHLRRSPPSESYSHQIKHPIQGSHTRLVPKNFPSSSFVTCGDLGLQAGEEARPPCVVSQKLAIGRFGILTQSLSRPYSM